MTNYLMIVGFMIILTGLCGCTQPSAPIQPAATMTTVNAPAPVYTVVTTIPVPQSTNHVSDNTITIKQDGFDPVSITVEPGATVRWVNADSTDDPARYNPTHRISIANVKDSPLLSPGEGWSWIFYERDTYYFSDMIHPSLQGTVIVK